MGYTAYCCNTRAVRSASMGYGTKPSSEIFAQSKERRVHASMDSRKIGDGVRECRDSEAHPNTVAAIVALDLTGSMGQIPAELVKDGLPQLMGDIIQKGEKDISLMFVGVGDHEYDKYPLQVGQFESGDAELDMWLTRTYLEGGGGGNAGESYLLAWYLAAKHTAIDCFEKRGKKGFLFTIGDEPGLNKLPVSAIKENMGLKQANSYTDKELLEAAQEKYNVFHVVVNHRYSAKHSIGYWKDMLGQNCLVVEKATDVAKTIADTIISHSSLEGAKTTAKSKKAEKCPKSENAKVEEIL